MTALTGNFTSGTFSYTPPSGFSEWDADETIKNVDVSLAQAFSQSPSVAASQNAGVSINSNSSLSTGGEKMGEEYVDISLVQDFLSAFSVGRIVSASDSVSLSEADSIAYGKSEAEDIACDDAIPPNLYLGQLVAQTLGISPELAPQVIQIVALASTSGLSDDPIIGFGASPSDAVGMDDAFLVGVGQVLAATLGVGPSLDSLLKTSLAAGDEVGADDSTSFSFDLLAEDALGAAEDLALLLVFDEFLTDAAAADDAPAAAVGFISVASDALGLDEVPSTLIAAIESVSETAALGGVLRFPDAEYVAWVVNSENLALSRYSGYAFNSMAAFQGTYLGATDTGIYEMEGADDAGTDIDARIRTGLMEFGSSRQKAMPAAYLGYTADGSLGLKVTTTDGGTRTETWYKLTETKDAPDTARLRVGKGLKARYWGFELVNVDGADFEVDHLHLYPVVLTRRI